MLSGLPSVFSYVIIVTFVFLDTFHIICTKLNIIQQYTNIVNITQTLLFGLKVKKCIEVLLFCLKTSVHVKTITNALVYIFIIYKST